MSEPRPLPGPREHRRSVSRRAVVGAVLALVGSLMLTGVFVLTYSRAPGHERLLFELGMAASTLISGLGQIFVVAGVWLLWSAAHDRRR